MTRFASIMGVATVATLVLLSGCETPMKTDYAKKLEGTWTLTLDRQVPPDPAAPTVTVPVMTAVEASVTRTDTNKGTVSIAISDTPPMPAGAPAIAETTVTGSIEVTSSMITVTITDLTVTRGGVEVPNDTLPPTVQGLATAPQKLDYTITDDELEIASPLLPVLLGDPTHTGSLTLTKK